MTTLTDEDRQILRKAADEILRRGICRTFGRNYAKPLEECEVCALGAVALVITGEPDDWALLWRTNPRIVDALGDAVPSSEDDSVIRVYQWNDHQLPSAEEVAELFLNVADNY